jgi:NAD+ kinase
LGINLGRVGFLTEVDIPDIFPALDKLLAGAYHIEERMMLEAMVYRGDELVEHSFGLNEVVLANGAFARLLILEVHVNDEYVNTYSADGMIVASPTGSTAYSLSAGGPLITPDLNVLLITPVCPHSLSDRPLVVHPESTIRIRVFTTVPENVMLTMDGQYGVQLMPMDRILIKQAVPRVKFIRFDKRGFFELLRKKLREERKLIFDQ